MIAAAGTNRFRMIANTADQTADALVAFELPDSNATRTTSTADSAASAQPSGGALRTRMSEAEFKGPGPALPDGDGKQVVARMCTSCHGTAVFSGMRMSREGWDAEVAAMVEKGAVGTREEAATVVAYLVKHFGK